MGKKYSKDCKGGEDCNDDAHLCKIAGRRDLTLVRELVRNSRYVCRKCGRAAHNYVNLCKPEEL